MVSQNNTAETMNFVWNWKHKRIVYKKTVQNKELCLL